MLRFKSYAPKNYLPIIQINLYGEALEKKTIYFYVKLLRFTFTANFMISSPKYFLKTKQKKKKVKTINSL